MFPRANPVDIPIVSLKRCMYRVVVYRNSRKPVAKLGRWGTQLNPDIDLFG